MGRFKGSQDSDTYGTWLRGPYQGAYTYVYVRTWDFRATTRPFRAVDPSYKQQSQVGDKK